MRIGIPQTVILAVIISLNVGSTLPSFLNMRYGTRAWKYLSFAALFLICLFPVLPSFLSSFFISLVLFCLYGYVFFKDPPFKRLSFCVIFFSIIGAWSFLTVVVFSLVGITAGRVIFMVFYALLYALYFTSVNLLSRKARNSPLSSFTSMLWAVVALIALCPSIVILLLVLNPPSSQAALVITPLISIIASTLMIPLIHQIGRSQSLAEENSYLRARTQYYAEMASDQNAMNKFRHDLMNHFTVISTYLDLGENEKALSYFKELGTNFSLITRNFTEITSVNAVLNNKNRKASSESIEIEFDVDMPKGKWNEVELCTILANAIDNAIEARPADNKIYVSLLESGGNLVFKCVNKYSGEIKRKPDGGFMTSKMNPSNHGFGIENIEKSVKKLGGNLSVSTDGNVFTLIATVPIPS